jgi:hypothetical protein
MVEFLSYYFISWLQCTRFSWIIQFCLVSIIVGTFLDLSVPEHSLLWSIVMSLAIEVGGVMVGEHNSLS